MNSQTTETKRILAINFGGIGDEILFLPTLKTIKRLGPQCSITLLLEPRSRSVEQLTTLIDKMVTFDIKKRPLMLSDLLDLLSLIKEGGYDCIVSSGGSPMVAGLLFLSGVRERVGYGTSRLGHLLLTEPVSLNKNQYAADMYHDLAIGYLRREAARQDSGTRLGNSGRVPLTPPPGRELLTPSPTKRELAMPPPTRRELMAPSLTQELMTSPPTGQVPEVDLKEDSLERMRNFLASEGLLKSDEHRKLVLLHPGTSALATKKGIIKTWSVEKWLELLRLISRYNELNRVEPIVVILAGGPDDEEIMKEIQAKHPVSPYVVSAYGKTKNIADLAALIHLSDLLVCVDSGPMHIGVGVGKKTVALFGPTNPALLLPSEPKYFAIWDKRDGNRYMFDKLGVVISAKEVFAGVLGMLDAGVLPKQRV